MSVEVEARDDRHAYEVAVQLDKLLKAPMVKMAISSEGIRLSGDAIVHQPQRI
jgi:hypothetical protein